jgi:hypothetical protein
VGRVGRRTGSQAAAQFPRLRFRSMELGGMRRAVRMEGMSKEADVVQSHDVVSAAQPQQG